jgi:serine/threonine-protein kinase RsbW
MDAAAVRTESMRLRREARRLRDDAVARTNKLLEHARQHGLGAHGTELRLRLPRMHASVGVARTSVERWLEARRVPAEDASDIVLATSEACANAVEHPRAFNHPAFIVTGCCRGGSVEISVQDFGHWRDDASDGTRGRGLAMIRALMDAVAIDEMREGTRLRMARRYSGTST